MKIMCDMSDWNKNSDPQPQPYWPLGPPPPTKKKKKKIIIGNEDNKILPAHWVLPKCYIGKSAPVVSRNMWYTFQQVWWISNENLLEGVAWQCLRLRTQPQGRPTGSELSSSSQWCPKSWTASAPSPGCPFWRVHCTCQIIANQVYIKT